MKNKNLFLIVTKEWYDKISSGEKRIEYREDTKYWRKRLMENCLCHKDFNCIEFQCGYSRKYPRLKFEIERIFLTTTPEEVKNTVKTELCYAIYFKDFYISPLGSLPKKHITKILKGLRKNLTFLAVDEVNEMAQSEINKMKKELKKCQK